jgi:dihydrofolate reductase
MKISIIVAVDENWGIGLKNQVPWRLSQDLKRFRQITSGHHLLMGRKTYESIGFPLPGRISIIISRQKNLIFVGEFSGKVLTASSLVQGIQIAKAHGEQELFIIGGGQIYSQALPQTDCIYLTQVHALCGCDTFFPVIDPGQWKVIQREVVPQDEKNQYASTFSLLIRIEAGV